MHIGAFTRYIDVAQVTLYAFWIFFAGLIYYLRSEDRREGFPLVSERAPYKRLSRFIGIPRPKTLLLVNGETRTLPRDERSIPVTTAAPAEGWPGAPLRPIGDPMLAHVGPGAYVARPDTTDKMFEDGTDKIVPMRTRNELWIDREGVDPRGMKVLGADGKVAGTLIDVWVDRAEMLPRYFELAIPTLEGTRQVLIPVPMVNVGLTSASVRLILSTQFAQAPVLKNPNVVTQLEEELISAYFGGGTLYATPARQEPFI